MFHPYKVNRQLIAEVEEILEALTQMLESQHYQPQLYLQRIRELARKIERASKEEVPFKEELLNNLKALYTLLGGEPDKDSLAQHLDDLEYVLNLIIAAVDSLESLREEFKEIEADDDYTSGFLMMIRDLAMGNVKKEVATAYLSNLADILSNLSKDFIVFYDDRESARIYERLADVVREMKSLVLDMEDSSQVTELAPEFKRLILEFKEGLRALKDRGVVEKEDILPSRHSLEVLSMGDTSSPVTSNSPYVLKLGELLKSLEEGTSREEILDRILLIVEILKKRLQSLDLLSKGLIEYPEASSTARSYAETLRGILKKSSDLLIDLEEKLSEEELDLSSLKEIWEKLSDLDRKVVKIVS